MSLAEAVRASGYPAVRLAEVLKRGVDDRAWLTYTAEKGYIALTKDKNLGRIPLSIGTVLASKARVVTFSVGPATGPELAALATRVIPAIARSVGPVRRACIFRVTASGALTEIKIPKKVRVRFSR